MKLHSLHSRVLPRLWLNWFLVFGDTINEILFLSLPPFWLPHSLHLPASTRHLPLFHLSLLRFVRWEMLMLGVLIKQRRPSLSLSTYPALFFPKALCKLSWTKGKDKILQFCSNHFLTLRHETARLWRSAYSKDLLFANGANNRQSKLSGSLQTRELWWTARRQCKCAPNEYNPCP